MSDKEKPLPRKVFIGIGANKTPYARTFFRIMSYDEKAGTCLCELVTDTGKIKKGESYLEAYVACNEETDTPNKSSIQPRKMV